MATTNEHGQPIRLTIAAGDRLRTVTLTGTVWGATTVSGAGGAAELRAGRVKHGGREYAVRWSATDAAWVHVGTLMQYDPNERGE